MTGSDKKPHTQHGACDGVSPDVPQTRATRSAVVNSPVFNMILGGLVCLIALLCSLSMVTTGNRPVPFSEPPSGAVDHVNP